ncbi:MAG: 16S rRNA (uracil(1498)-N(3))-methyltransferase [Bacteroidales bacterium]|nr:16S rRNA (uracil(1498)-N(3))-methyltransferase [Bacteroidales bacterium]MDE7072265.1 16S rRNA (uracil(1498)-N(3))-methyltransferase [Bacteroidales bacterium]
MFLFYAPEEENGQCRFSVSESRHCAKVLRLLPGQEVWVTDGKGFLYLADLTVVSDKVCMAHIRQTLRRPDEEGNHRPDVHIVMAPTKSMERTEWFLEKATEVGLGSVSFLCTERSERRQIKEERVEAILVAAMKQSQQAYLPRMHGMCSLKAYLDVSKNRTDGAERQKFIAYCGPEYERKNYLELLRPHRSVEVMIGPEGDFTPEEVALCVKEGYIPVSLGSTRLRTETAALFAAWAPACR